MGVRDKTLGRAAQGEKLLDFGVDNDITPRHRQQGEKLDFYQECLRICASHLHTHVYCGTIHNSQVMETAKMPPY
jgi:hypothetical protein